MIETHLFLQEEEMQRKPTKIIKCKSTEESKPSRNISRHLWCYKATGQLLCSQGFLEEIMEGRFLPQQSIKGIHPATSGYVWQQQLLSKLSPKRELWASEDLCCTEAAIVQRVGEVAFEPASKMLICSNQILAAKCVTSIETLLKVSEQFEMSYVWACCQTKRSKES